MSSDSEADTTCVSTTSTSYSSCSDLGDTSIASRKHKQAALKRSKKEKQKAIEKQKKKLKNKITKGDFCTKSIEFKVWLQEKKSLVFDNLNEKQQKEYFKKFVKKWNTKKLDQKYYRGVDCLWAMGTPNTQINWAMPGQTEVTPGSLHEDTFETKYSRLRPESMAGLETFGKKAGAKLLRQLRAMENIQTDDATDPEIRNMPIKANSEFCGDDQQSSEPSCQQPDAQSIEDWPAPPSPYTGTGDINIKNNNNNGVTDMDTYDPPSPLPPQPKLNPTFHRSFRTRQSSRKLTKVGIPRVASKKTRESKTDLSDTKTYLPDTRQTEKTQPVKSNVANTHTKPCNESNVPAAPTLKTTLNKTQTSNIPPAPPLPDDLHAKSTRTRPKSCHLASTPSQAPEDTDVVVPKTRRRPLSYAGGTAPPILPKPSNLLPLRQRHKSEAPKPPPPPRLSGQWHKTHVTGPTIRQNVVAGSTIPLTTTNNQISAPQQSAESNQVDPQHHKVPMLISNHPQAPSLQSTKHIGAVFVAASNKQVALSSINTHPTQRNSHPTAQLPRTASQTNKSPPLSTSTMGPLPAKVPRRVDSQNSAPFQKNSRRRSVSESCYDTVVELKRKSPTRHDPYVSQLSSASHAVFQTLTNSKGAKKPGEITPVRVKPTDSSQTLLAGSKYTQCIHTPPGTTFTMALLPRSDFSPWSTNL